MKVCSCKLTVHLHRVINSIFVNLILVELVYLQVYKFWYLSDSPRFSKIQPFIKLQNVTFCLKLQNLAILDCLIIAKFATLANLLLGYLKTNFGKLALDLPFIYIYIQTDVSKLLQV